jgi:hypothetical protein
MMPDTNFYHTKFPFLANALEGAMVEYIEKKSKKKGILSSIFGPSKEEKALECVRATNMIAILKYLKRGLRKTENDPLNVEDKAILILTYLVWHSKQKLVDIVLPRIIGIPKYPTGHFSNGLYHDALDASLGNKAFQDPREVICYQINKMICINQDPIGAVRHILAIDIVKSGVMTKYVSNKINTQAVDLLLNGKSWSCLLIVPLTIACIWTLRKESVFASLPRDIFIKITKLVISNLKCDLFRQIEEVIPNSR